MEPLQIRGDPARSEVIVLPKVQDFADHIGRGCSRRPVRGSRSIAQACFTLRRKALLPVVKRGSREAKATAGLGKMRMNRRDCLEHWYRTDLRPRKSFSRLR
jgi:hypothetical protein